MTDLILVGILDDNQRLIGYNHRKSGEVRSGEVPLPEGCDLPADGTYKWDGRRFVPLGHGHGRVISKPPVPESLVLYLLIRSLPEVPLECREWAEWYKKNLARREEELSLRQRVRKHRR